MSVPISVQEHAGHAQREPLGGVKWSLAPSTLLVLSVAVLVLVIEV